MVHLLSIRASKTRNLCRIYRRFQSNYENISHRDVFVDDFSFSKSQWDQYIAQDSQKGSKAFKHPQSQHVVAKYSASTYAKGDYNFNVVGEYSLNITPVFEPILRLKSTSFNEKKHKIIIWPDGIIVNNLSDIDIPILFPLFLRNHRIRIQDLQLILHPSTEISKLTNRIVICAVSPFVSSLSAQKSLMWMNDAAASLSLPDTMFVVSTNLGAHRESTGIFILPDEDSFMTIDSEARAKAILQRYV